MHKMNAHLATIESASQIILTNQQMSEEHAHQHENTLNELLQNIDAIMVSSATKGMLGKKNILNKHPALKVNDCAPSNVSYTDLTISPSFSLYSLNFVD
jgi:hypothetical protein